MSVVQRMPNSKSFPLAEPLKRAPYLAPLFLSALSALLFLPGLGSRDFWAPGEPIYGEVIRVMFEKGEWLVPTLNGQLFPDKPILYYWLALIVSKIAGHVSEWTVRLPAALGGLGLVLVTYEFGRIFFSRETGLFAGIVLATTSRLLWESRFLRLDTVLSCFLFLGFYFFVRAFLRKGPPALYLCAYVCFALATLTKGPIGLALPGLTILALLLASQSWREVRRMRLFSGLIAVLALLSPWLISLHFRGQDRWLGEFLWIHNVQNYALEPIGHVRPFYYYLINLPPDFLPWTLIIPGALIFYYPWRDRLRDPVVLGLFCWFAVIFSFFSFSKSKISYYLLPLLPSLALLGGSYLCALCTPEQRAGAHWRLTEACLHVLAVALLASGIALPWVSWRMEPGLFGWAVAISIALALGGATMIISLRRRKILFCLSALVTTLLAAALSGGGILPYLNRFKSPRPLAEYVKSRVPPNAPVYVYQSTMSDFNFYAGREEIAVVPSPQALERLRAQSKESYLLVDEKHLTEIAQNPALALIAERQIGDRKWYLLKLR
jgi:4-amino-4-deoxy-L-arabinose transferase-like glycosyltransferase